MSKKKDILTETEGEETNVKELFFNNVEASRSVSNSADIEEKKTKLKKEIPSAVKKNIHSRFYNYMNYRNNNNKKGE